MDKEQILDQCIENVRQGKTLEEVILQYPDIADEIRPLLELACELQEIPSLSPSIVGVERIMAKLSDKKHAPVKPAVGERVRLFSRPVLIRAAILLFCVLFLGWGTVFASSRAVPGDLLYPVKLITENVRIFLAFNRENRAELRIVFSQERLKEFVRKHSQGDGIDKDLLVAMLEEAKMAIESYPDFSDVNRQLLLSRIASLSEYQGTVLLQVTGRATPQEKEALEPFIETCNRRCSWIQEMMPPKDKEPGRTSREQVLEWMGKCPLCPVESCGCSHNE